MLQVRSLCGCTSTSRHLSPARSFTALELKVLRLLLVATLLLLIVLHCCMVLVTKVFMFLIGDFQSQNCFIDDGLLAPYCSNFGEFPMCILKDLRILLSRTRKLSVRFWPI